MFAKNSESPRFLSFFLFPTDNIQELCWDTLDGVPVYAPCSVVCLIVHELHGYGLSWVVALKLKAWALAANMPSAFNVIYLASS